MAWIRACGGGSSPSVPDGRTVTPINDVTIWQQCAGIANPTYTTLAEVLADVGVLSVLMASDNAVDYLVRCKNWCGTALVPTMTSNTTPSGEASAKTTASSTYPAWKAFDNDNSTNWASNATGKVLTGDWLRYQFSNSAYVDQAKIIFNINAGATSETVSFEIQGSNNGSDFTSIKSFTVANNETNEVVVNIDIVQNYLYYQLYVTSGPSGYGINGVKSLQLYCNSICQSSNAMTYIGQNNYASNTLLGDPDWETAIYNSNYVDKVMNVHNPDMTSNTNPSGSVSYSSQDTGNEAWHLFNANDANYGWTPVKNESNSWAKYQFANPFTAKAIVYYIYRWQGASRTKASVTYYLEVSSDNTNWITLDSFSTGSTTSGSSAYSKTWKRAFKCNNTFSYVRLRASGVMYEYSNNTSLGADSAFTLRVYNREDV